MTYTQEQKERIKANPLNRLNAMPMRTITTWKFRDFQATERALSNATAKTRKELQANYDKAKSIYEEALSKLNLYKEIFPDLYK